MDSLALPWANTEMMSMFLTMVFERHGNEFVIMVVNQAGWHIAAGIEVPANMRLVFLPPYSPKINSAEHILVHPARKRHRHTAFRSLGAADKALGEGLLSLELDPQKMQSLTGFE
jgi:hypothetical protein